MEYMRVSLIFLSFLVSDITAAMQVESVKKADIEIKAPYSIDLYIEKSMIKLHDLLPTLKIPTHLQPVFLDISEGIIRLHIAAFVKELNDDHPVEAFNQLSTIKPGLSQFTIAYAMGGSSGEKEALYMTPFSVPEKIAYEAESIKDNFDKALDIFVQKVLNEVFRQYDEARTSTITIFSLDESVESFAKLEGGPSIEGSMKSSDKITEKDRTTQLINRKYFISENGYFNPESAKLIPLSTGGAFTEGLWMLKIKGELGKWSNRLIIKEVKRSNAFAELKALSIVTSDPVISAVSMGMNNLQQLKKLDKDGSGISIRAKKMKYLQSNSSWVPDFLPKLTFDVTQYKIDDHAGKSHYLSVLGLAKGKPISDYFKSAVIEAAPLSSDEFATSHIPSVELFYKAMKASGLAFAQFHQVTNQCMLFGEDKPDCNLLAYAHGDGHFHNIFYDGSLGEDLGKIYWIDNATLALNSHPELAEDGENPLADPLMGLKSSVSAYGPLKEFLVDRDTTTKLLPIQGDVGYFYLRPMTWIAIGQEGITELMKIDKNKHLLEIFFNGVKIFLKAYISQYPEHIRPMIQEILYHQFIMNTIKNGAFIEVIGEEAYKLPPDIDRF